VEDSSTVVGVVVRVRVVSGGASSKSNSLVDSEDVSRGFYKE
jgi:hypothetical protein